VFHWFIAMPRTKAIVVLSFAVAPFSLHGCGGGSDDNSGAEPHVKPNEPTTTGAASTTPDVTPDVPPGSATTTGAFCDDAHTVPKSDESPEGKLVSKLNWRYMSWDEADPESPKGVTIRMVGPDTSDDARFFCGSECHGGYPDCRVSSSLYNNKMLTKHKTHEVAVTMKRYAGILYNQTSIENIMGKCVYMYDGATFGRVNHGCGCAAKRGGCGPPDSAYGNQDCEYEDRSHRSGIKEDTCHNNTESSPDVDNCWCKANHRDHDTPRPEDTKTESQQCFFRLGGIYPANGPFPDELHDFVKARLWNQANPPTETLSNDEIRYKQEYWNEIVIEGEELRNKLNENPLHAITAFIYVSGSFAGKQKAQLMQQQILAEYGGLEIPIVELDPHVDTRCSGPFRMKRDMPTTTTTQTTTTWDGYSCADQFDQCGGKIWEGPTCCKVGECAAENDYYAACKVLGPSPIPPFQVGLDEVTV